MMNQTIEILKDIYKNAGKHIIFSEEMDYLKAILNYYKDIPLKPRYYYDGDAVYFYNYDPILKNQSDLAQRGDVMASLWMLLISYLRKGKRFGKKEINIIFVLNLLEQQDSQVLKAYKELHFLCEHYWSRGNILLLPNTKNNNGKRNFNSNRGIWFEDKIDQMLWHCFENGRLRCYFESENGVNPDENLIYWIKKERLECLFMEEFFSLSLECINKNMSDINTDISSIEISRECLQAMVPNMSNEVSTYRLLDLSDADRTIYIENVNKIIAYRNNNKPLPYEPLKW